MEDKEAYLDRVMDVSDVNHSNKKISIINSILDFLAFMVCFNEGVTNRRCQHCQNAHGSWSIPENQSRGDLYNYVPTIYIVFYCNPTRFWRYKVHAW